MQEQEKLKEEIMGLRGQLGGSGLPMPDQDRCGRENAKSQLRQLIDRLGRDSENAHRQHRQLQALYHVLPERLEGDAELGLYELLELARRGAGKSSSY